MVTVVDEPPHPQALFLGFDEGDSDFLACAKLVARSKTLGTAEEARELRLLDWDILVVKGDHEIRVPVT